MKLRTCTIFTSEVFNTTEPKPEFVHPENYGDDVARWFMARIRERGSAVDEEDPSQEDHGWYVTFTLSGCLYDLVIAHVPADGGSPRWLACIERSVGLFGTMMGRRHRGVTAEAVQLVHDILVQADESRNVGWLYFDDVRRGNLGTPSPSP